MEQQKLFELYKFTADAGQSHLRVDKFLYNKIENVSRNKIQNAAKQGYILIDGKPVKSNRKVKPGNTIIVMSNNEPHETELIPENIPIDIIYEDDVLMVINKEAGMVVHPSYGHRNGTLVNALMYHIKDCSLFDSENQRPGLVHRLDKNTTGLLVIAKTEHSLSSLSKQFFNRTTVRRYNALIWGRPKEPEGTITGNIGRSLKDRKVMDVFPKGEYGKHAVTHYKIIEEFGYVTLIECKLETGRTHQIRAHLKHIGHPLFNDSEYGGNKILKGTRFSKYKQFIDNCFKIIPRQALHAKTLSFTHPATGENVSFKSELPDDMKEIIEKWRNYVKFTF